MPDVSENTERKSSRHHLFTQISQKHGYTKQLFSKSSGDFSSEVSDLIPMGVCQKLGGKKCFFHLENDVPTRNINKDNEP